MKLTKEVTIKLHRSMWNWLADNPDKSKYQWPGWIYFDTNIENDCFLCDYAKKSIRPDCTKCPLSWGMTITCGDNYSYYNYYNDSEDDQERSTFARKIANLKEM